jgi:hypothetical protein
MLISAHPLFPFLSLYYLLGELASLLVARIPVYSCPWSADNCPHPLLVHPSLHTPHFKLQYLHRQHQQRQASLSGTLLLSVPHNREFESSVSLKNGQFQSSSANTEYSLFSKKRFKSSLSLKIDSSCPHCSHNREFYLLILILNRKMYNSAFFITRIVSCFAERLGKDW